MPMDKRSITLLRLLHLADSALPIGSVAHSYGLETLVYDKDLSVEQLEDFFRRYLTEVGVLEANYCRQAYAFGGVLSGSGRSAVNMEWGPWLALNRRLSARKMARESREASATLGRRLIRLVLSLEADDLLHQALDAAKDTDLHHATVFGLLGGYWDLGENDTVAALLQQMLTGLVSACQRLMPLGQSRAQSIVWSLQPAVSSVMQRTAFHSVSGELAAEDFEFASFATLLEVGSMRHPTLPTRLFIS